MIRFYNTAILPFRLAAGVWGRWQILTSRHRREWEERLARRLPEARPGAVWIHGSSVGEARIVRGLASGLRRHRAELPIAVSAYTATGRAQLPRHPEVDAAFFMPLDFSGLPSKLLKALRPVAIVLVETELWPNLLREAEHAGVTVVVVNGRLSERRMVSYRRFAKLYRPLLSGLAAVGAQSEEDALRFRELGASPEAVSVTGNVKYDLQNPRVDLAGLRQRLGLSADRPVFVAGSTGQGEDRPVLEAFGLARKRHPTLLLVLAPRHPERFDDVEQQVRSAGLRVERFSAEKPSAGTDVILVDTIGELQQLYSVAAAAFVGGSLVPIGGHNVLEPAVVDVPVLFGPHTENVTEPASELERAGGALRTGDARELGEAVATLISEPERAKRLVENARRVLTRNRGALDRSLRIVLEAAEASSRRTEAGVR
jgi:3-deoxy-D-manno-octulosonic-acid transferase